jgi:hypothetical protein
VSFLTDYGLSDAFVAACHGVLLRAVPAVRIVDVTHLVPAGDVRRGATVLADAVGHLPPGTVHLAVVDPGVGTRRRPVALVAPGGMLVGPDNGLLPPAADLLGGISAAVELAVAPGTPATFHGRDVFAPAAAALVAGTPPDAVGVLFEPSSLVRLPVPVARLVPGAGVGGPAHPAGSVGSTRPSGSTPPPGSTHPAGPASSVLEAEVVSVDHFGNVALAAGADLLAAAGLRVGSRAMLGLPGGAAVAVAVATTFGSVPAGDLVLYVNSTGRAALAVNRGDAAARLLLAPGALVRATLAVP